MKKQLHTFSKYFKQLPLLFVLGFTLASSASWARPLDCKIVPELFNVYLKNHYAHNDLTKTLKDRTVEQFIKNLDPSHTTLLSTDIEQMEKQLPSVFETMKNGNCALFEQIYNTLVERSQENHDFVKKFLDKKYKLDESVELVLDPEKRSYAKNKEEKETLLKAVIHFQISSYLTSGTKLDKAKSQLIKRYELGLKRVKELKKTGMIENFVKAFAGALDPHTSYLSQDDMDDFKINMNLSLEGIGASLISQDGYTIIQEVIPGGSADRSKLLQPKDKILSVAQASSPPVTVMDMDLRDVVKLIRGKKGTKVRLTILRQKEKAETFEVTLVRDKVDIQEQAAKIYYEDRKIGDKTYKIGILDLPSFYGGGDDNARSSYEDVKKLLAEAKTKKIDGLILDLSRNGGGLLQDAVRISGLFIKEGPVVGVQDTQKRKQILADEDPAVQYSGPLMVLTSRVSASASEILAGALKGYKRALIVGGDHTFGKGSVQMLNALPMELGGMKYTTAMYFLPNGPSTQNEGVTADIALPSPFSNDEIGEKNLPYALPAVSIDPFIGTSANAKNTPEAWNEINTALVSSLSEKSKKRVEKNEKFKEILKDLADAEKNKGPVKLAELRKKSSSDPKKKNKNEEDEFIGKSMQERRKEFLEAPQLQESINIIMDWIGQGTAIAKNKS